MLAIFILKQAIWTLITYINHTNQCVLIQYTPYIKWIVANDENVNNNDGDDDGPINGVGDTDKENIKENIPRITECVSN